MEISLAQSRTAALEARVPSDDPKLVRADAGILVVPARQHVADDKSVIARLNQVVSKSTQRSEQQSLKAVAAKANTIGQSETYLPDAAAKVRFSELSKHMDNDSAAVLMTAAETKPVNAIIAKYDEVKKAGSRGLSAALLTAAAMRADPFPGAYAVDTARTISEMLDVDADLAALFAYGVIVTAGRSDDDALASWQFFSSEPTTRGLPTLTRATLATAWMLGDANAADLPVAQIYRTRLQQQIDTTEQLNLTTTISAASTAVVIVNN